MAFTHNAESPYTGNYYRFKEKLDQEDQRAALRSSISGSSCTHSYDCCGCASTYASVRKVKPGVFAVKARISYNY